jgi:phage tail sheath protein FI
MAETLVSPGVLARENDQSFLVQSPTSVGASIIGPTTKGPVEIPTIVTSYSDYENKFGGAFISGGDSYSFLTAISAYNYFINGGNSLLVARVVSASSTWSPATSSNIVNNIATTPGGFATSSTIDLSAIADNDVYNIYYNGQYYSFVVDESPLPSDNIFNRTYYVLSGSTEADTVTNLSNKINGALSGSAASSSVNLVSASANGTDLVYSGSLSGSALNGNVHIIFNDLTVVGSTLDGGFDGVGSNAFTLETLSEGIIMNSTSTEDSAGALPSGSSDNIRWAVQNANTGSGTFTLLIRQGNDTTNSQVVLETWTNLSLDPTQPNYIAAVLGDQKQNYNPSTNQIETSGSYANRSNYVRVKAVNNTTPNYYDNNGVAKSQYTASIPVNTSGSFGVATGTITPAGAKFYNEISNTDTQGLSDSDYANMIALLSNQDDYRFNILTTPGLVDAFATNTGQITNVILNTQNRGDSIYIPDMVGYGSTVGAVTAQAANRDTSYAATYWPWCQVLDPETGKNVWVPASTLMPGVYAFNDRAADPWFAPAGINRGGLGQVIRAEQKLSQAGRDSLYTGKVNPIATFPGTGVVVYGQKTLQTKASALDRVNVRRLLIQLKGFISQVANNLVFEQNTLTTRNNFLSIVNPYLESVQQRQGLYAFRVIMDDSNNTADVIDRNQLVGQIFIQPTKTAEFIYLDFSVLPTGATFPA